MGSPIEIMLTNKVQPTEAQESILRQLKAFIDDTDERVFILRGYAGTGKTTLIRFLIPLLKENHINYLLLATTGRAAKVLSNYSGYDTSTIHHLIYHFDRLNQDLSEVDEQTLLDNTGQLFLNFEPVQSDSESACIYIIDESSMISDSESKDITQAQFGSGRLLKELLEYDSNNSSKFVFVGDPCQLPPIESTNSPALDAEYIRKTFQFSVRSAELTQILRQDNENDIISTASSIRNLYTRAPETDWGYGRSRVWGKLPFKGRKNIVLHPSSTDLINSYLSTIQEKSHNKTIYIARSNRQCRDVCNIVRASKGFKNSVCKGDLLMVIQNQLATGLMNGDFIEVLEVGNIVHRTFKQSHYETSTIIAFQEVKVRESFSQREYETLLMIDCLQQGNLDSVQQSGLFLDFAIRMKQRGITQKTNTAMFNEMLARDPFLNALRCSYGYAVTCHKAQGGEWEDVFVDVPRNFMLNPTKATYQWIYTALTRAKETFHCVEDFYIK